MLDRLSPSERDALKGFATALRRAFGPRLRDLRLFGSRARGEGHEDSDLDVLVVVADELGDVRGRIYDVAVDQELAYGVVLSPFVRTETEFAELRRRQRAIAQEIVRDGVPL